MGHYRKNGRKWTPELLVEAVKTSGSFAETLRKLDLRPSGGNYDQLKKYISEFNLDTSHQLGQAHWRGKNQPSRNKIPLEEILRDNVHYGTNALKKRLLANGYLEHRCYKCKNVTWNELPIPLELEHINGTRTDNRLENLTLLCPNCHAQTATYRGKNIKKRASVGMVYEDSLKESADISVRVRVSPGARLLRVCVSCPKVLKCKATRCRDCYNAARRTKIQWPPVAALLEKLNNGVSYLALSRELGVTDNAIRKHIKSHGE